MMKFTLVGIVLFHHCFISYSSSQHQFSDPNYRFMKEATTAPKISFYDYVIIGGGTAGCPLAATLSHNATVLLLERGGSPYGNPNITDLSLFGRTLGDTFPASPSQRFISEDGVVNTRARVLGGGSCLNAGFYTRAAADYVRSAGWDAALVNESYAWVEKVVAFQPKMKQWQSAIRDGLLEAGVKPYNNFTYDHLIGTKVGGTIFDADGRRHTAADLLKYANPGRLKVLLHAHVHKILFNIEGKSRPLAHGVTFRDEAGELHRAYARNEIVLSSGAIGSPQILMLSGIGPMDHLKAHNITLVLDQPFVGQGMSDNPMNAVFVPSPAPVEVSLIEVVGITSAGSYIEAASGENFVGGSLLRFGMFSPKIEWLEETLDSTMIMQGGFILEKIMGPISTGHLRLNSTDPDDNPIVTFNYFSDPRDVQRCVAGMKVIQSVVESKAFSPFRYDYITFPFLLNLTAGSGVNLRPKHANSSTSMEQFCKDTVMTIWHYHGGCQVGRVVDSEYRVLGVDALRVIDGSTFNYSPGTNPQATVMMLGRYMGVKMVEGRR